MSDFIKVMGPGAENKGTPFTLLSKSMMQMVMAPDGSSIDSSGDRVYRRKILTDENQLIMLGVRMEKTSALLNKVNEEVKESSQILNDLWNETTATYELLEPELLKMIKRIRDTRMTVTMELNQSLVIMRDVRKFFLESEYDKEIKNLERFVVIGERMKALMQDGTADAITDIMLKLADVEGGDDEEEKGAD